MTQKSSYCIAAGVAVGASIMMGGAVYAAPVGVSNIENFIRNIIQVVAGLAGLIATGFLLLVASRILRARVIQNSLIGQSALSPGRRSAWWLLLPRMS